MGVFSNIDGAKVRVSGNERSTERPVHELSGEISAGNEVSLRSSFNS